MFLYKIAGKSIDIIRDEKFQQIVQRRRLVDLAKAQAQEVAFLRSEVERFVFLIFMFQLIFKLIKLSI